MKHFMVNSIRSRVARLVASSLSYENMYDIQFHQIRVKGGEKKKICSPPHRNKRDGDLGTMNRPI